MAIIENILTNTGGQDVVVYIEVDDAPSANGSMHAGEIPRDLAIPIQAQDAFTKAMDLIRTCAEQVSNNVSSIPESIRPAAFEVQFAVKIDAEVGAVLAKSSTEAQLQVSLMWGTKLSK
ncbi:CU044_2847 family protein [Dictyobacter arantiisoli]|uniref:Trypsin-co-occurring domain-containing protein n=1 Tax=Dictyobacter arantiisoli TaxID=2014874 RepID=A0A5A5T6E3_9CHLR|nr:CU044_2847 family protein [Dictyobacter arantiisoli]GCF06927.1 hypothetical protein KDI_04910 [Dictyobacter arantiisoli]